MVRQWPAAARARGFTLVELLVVLAIVATLLSIVAPRYFDSLERAKEAALRATLVTVRDAIDKHRADTGRLPTSLQQLVDARYLRAMPTDPLTESADGWILVPHPDGVTPGINDLRSAAAGVARDGTPFETW
jgi:general secretion pathway protein G